MKINYLNSYFYTMKLDKQHAKLIKLQTKAESCISRDEAQKIIRKAEKAQSKISG